MNRHPISIFRLLSRTNTLTLDPCNWLPRHLTGARMRAPQILVFYKTKLAPWHLAYYLATCLKLDTVGSGVAISSGRQTKPLHDCTGLSREFATPPFARVGRHQLKRVFS